MKYFALHARIRHRGNSKAQLIEGTVDDDGQAYIQVLRKHQKSSSGVLISSIYKRQCKHDIGRDNKYIYIVLTQYYLNAKVLFDSDAGW